MIRRIIRIDEEKCNGCGLCAKACHENAIEMVNGKAKLVSDHYCDGLGDCLPVCPMDAIHFEEREAAAYDQKAVEWRQQQQKQREHVGCPGTMARTLRTNSSEPQREAVGRSAADCRQSQLMQWPVQIKLVAENAPYLDGCKLLIAADCTAYAYGDFHDRFMKDRVTLIGCPKLDEGDYSEKLTRILQNNDIQNITVVRMEVPCCGGIVSAVKRALEASGKVIPWQIITIGTDGRIIEQ